MQDEDYKDVDEGLLEKNNVDIFMGWTLMDEASSKKKGTVLRPGEKKNNES